MTTYIVEYYRDPYEGLWRADVLDSNRNIVDFVWAPSIKEIKLEIENLKNKYLIDKVTKTSFYI